MNIKNNIHVTVLMMAALKGQVNCAIERLAGAAEINKRNLNGETILFHAYDNAMQLFTARKRSCGKLMFSQASVCS